MPATGIEVRNDKQGLPDTIDALVEEQDTCLVLGNSPVIKTPLESFPALVKKMERQKPRIPGEVMVIHSKPKRIVAIIYDINHKPICREEWIETAIINILQQCDAYQIRTLAMPLLGTTHGKIDIKTSTGILENIFIDHGPAYPEKIFLITE
jgi:hypothetical protein